MSEYGPVDHRQFITAFDVAGYTDAVNRVAERRGEAAHDKIVSCNREFDCMCERYGTEAVSVEGCLKDVIKILSTFNSPSNIEARGRLSNALVTMSAQAREWDSPR